MDAGSDALHCVEMASPHGRQGVASQDIVGTHNALGAVHQQGFCVEELGRLVVHLTLTASLPVGSLPIWRYATGAARVHEAMMETRRTENCIVEM